MYRLRLIIRFHLLLFSVIFNDMISAQFYYMADDIPDTTEISNILDRLTDNSTYDKRLRPKYGADPVDVGITMHVSSISAVSEVDMDFTLDFYLRQTWHDPRLAFRRQGETHADNIEALTVGVDYLEKLWKPDTFFPNEKKSYFHKATTHNSFLRIDPDGNVYTSQRLTVTATCHMKLHLFPMDSQKCKLEIESYGHSMLDIIYFFNKSKESISRSEFELPQFVLADVQFTSTVQKQSSGDYSRLVCVFLFKRNIGFYIIQIYLPSILIVVISWVSFWLSRDATPARVALGVLTVLTMTTLTTTTNAAMPKVSYVKSIDIFLGVSFLMVFSALLEYAAVGYISKRMQLVMKKKSTRAVSLSHVPNSSSVAFSAPSGSQTPLPTFADHLYQPFYSSKDKRSNLYNGDLLNPPVLLKEGECQCPIPPSSSSPPIRTITIPDKEEAVINCCCAGKLRPSEIDKYSRSVFPLIFIIFNITYWVYFYNISSTQVESDDFS